MTVSGTYYLEVQAGAGERASDAYQLSVALQKARG